MTLLSETAWAFPALALIVGLLVGSFLNVVIHRLPIMQQRLYAHWCREQFDAACAGLPAPVEPAETCPHCGHEIANWERLPLVNGLWLHGRCRSCRQTLPWEADRYNLSEPNSHCPACNTPIKPWQNVPVFGWLALRGKAACCGAPIHWRYPLVELLGGLGAGIVAWQLGFGLAGVAAIGLTWALLVLSGIDFATQELPDDITLPLVWAGLALALGQVFVDLETAVIGAMAGYLSLWTLNMAFRHLRGKEGMGYGDFKLLAALGAWLGWQALPEIILLASLSGTLVHGAGLLLRRGDAAIPFAFGPYLALAGWLSLITEGGIRQAYLTSVGLA